MRIAYVAGWEGGPDTGPFKKIVEQSTIWRALGHDVAVFVLTTSRHAQDWAAVPTVAQVVERGENALNLAKRKEQLVSDMLRWSPDLVYHRWSLPYPGLVRAARRRPVVLEINTDDVTEYDLLSPAKGKLNRLTRGAVLRRAAGLVFVADELRHLPAFRSVSTPSLVLGNGIALDQTTPAPPTTNARPRLVFIGQPGLPWHGLDKLMELARLRPAWDFDVVGPDPAELPGAPSNVVAHGALTASAYGPLMGSADIGLGTLALHRKQMSEASPLKVREYLAHGLPVVIGYRDTDFPGQSPFVLELPNTEDNVRTCVDRVDEFVNRWHGRRVERAAVQHLDSQAKEQRRLEFFGQIAGLVAPII